MKGQRSNTSPLRALSRLNIAFAVIVLLSTVSVVVYARSLNKKPIDTTVSVAPVSQSTPAAIVQHYQNQVNATIKNFDWNTTEDAAKVITGLEAIVVPEEMKTAHLTLAIAVQAVVDDNIDVAQTRRSALAETYDWMELPTE